MTLGYTGLTALGSLMEGIDTVETLLKIMLIISGVGILVWLYWKRQNHHPVHWFTQEEKVK